MIKLESDTLILGFDENNGSLIFLYSKLSSWSIMEREALGLSWRLLLPLEGRRNNNAWGHQQKKPVYSKTALGLYFEWDKVQSEFGGEHNIKIKTVCELKNGQAVFSMNIQNRDSVYVENVYYPYLGDLKRPSDSQRFTIAHGHYCNLAETELYPSFPNTRGYYGNDNPMVITGWSPATPPMYPFALLSDDKGNGLYIGITERRMEAATWMAELHPGYENSLDDKVPKGNAIGGKDVFVRFGPVHFPYIAPGSDFTLLPFAMEAYRGNWNTGTSCYTKTSKSWNREPSQPDWAKDPHAWLQLHINSPEDELRIKFRDLPKVGEDCVKHSIKAIQLVGWNNGGQDRGNPYHDPDPRLGTFDELKEAIARIQAMGVKVILFSKFNWADRSLPNFSKDFLPLAIKDPYGDYYMHPGYQYQTASQFMDINTRRLVPMCFLNEKYLDVCKNEFRKLVDLGAAGMLYDECLHHSPALCCFDTSHGHRYGAPVYGADEKLINAFIEILDGKEFYIAGEGIYDFQHNYYHLSYTRTGRSDHRPVSRLMRPHCAIMTAVTGFNDRNMINQCLMNRYIISYEPFNFKGMPSDFPETTSYGAKMDALRTELREYFWDGEFLGKQGGRAMYCGKAGETCIEEESMEFPQYSLFRGTNGRTGMIICNYSDEPVTVKPVFDQGEPKHYCCVEDNKLAVFNNTITIAPCSAAAVIG